MADKRVQQEPSAASGGAASTATAGVIAPPPLIYVVPLAVGLVLQHWYPIPLGAPSVTSLVGGVCVGLGFMGLPAVLGFRRAKTSVIPYVPTTAIVTTGPYRFTRNPMYLGFTLWYLGVTLWMNTAWPLFFLPFVLVVMHYGVIRREEAYLARKFGEEYERYRQRVRRWL